MFACIGSRWGKKMMDNYGGENHMKTEMKLMKKDAKKKETC
jgi:hypothetical protein